MREDFTCPKCGTHEFMVDKWAGESWAPWQIVCQNDECEWRGRYREHVYKEIRDMPPEALFRRLREMGVSCASCRQRELYGECQMDLVEDHFLCNEWSSDPKDITSAPPEG